MLLYVNSKPAGVSPYFMKKTFFHCKFIYKNKKNIICISQWDLCIQLPVLVKLRSERCCKPEKSGKPGISSLVRSVFLPKSRFWNSRTPRWSRSSPVKNRKDFDLWFFLMHCHGHVLEPCKNLGPCKHWAKTCSPLKGLDSEYKCPLRHGILASSVEPDHLRSLFSSNRRGNVRITISW